MEAPRGDVPEPYSRWWKEAYAAMWPEPRERLGGAGEVSANVPHWTSGVPVKWNRETLDPKDPPMYESQAAYLKRLGLLVEGEEGGLGPKDFEPVAAGV